MAKTSKKIASSGQKELLEILEARFNKNMNRHKGIEWNAVRERLTSQHEKLVAVQQMERSGGEPDVVILDKKLLYVDCSPETPKGRRSTSYDRDGQNSRKEHRPENNAMDMAAEMGIELLDEEQYRRLQTLGEFDLKTSSWIKTPDAIRKLGGALFCDRRYDHVFVYHNGAQSYYAVRGFRGWLEL